MRFHRVEQEASTFPELRPKDVATDSSVDLHAGEVTSPIISQWDEAVPADSYGHNLHHPHTDQSTGHLPRTNEEVFGRQSSTLRERLADKPDEAKKLAQELIQWLDTSGGPIESGAYDSRYYYYLTIKHLLPIVDEEIADQLFDRYPVNDLKPYWDKETAYDYKPLVSLFYDQEIPSKYKEASLAKWLEVAEQEDQSTIQPFAENERAIKNMADFVQTWVHGEEVDDDIHTSIISFIERHSPANSTYIDGFALTRVAEHITDDDVRFNFAWRHIIVRPGMGRERFRIDNDRDLSFVEWINEEANRRDLPDFEARAELLKQAYEAKPESE